MWSPLPRFPSSYHGITDDSITMQTYSSDAQIFKEHTLRIRWQKTASRHNNCLAHYITVKNAINYLNILLLFLFFLNPTTQQQPAPLIRAILDYAARYKFHIIIIE